MIKVVKSFVAFFVAVALLIILNTFLPSVMFLSSWWFTAIIIAVSNFLIVYLTTSPRKCESYGMVTREYIVSGRGELKQEVNDSYFKNMELLEKNNEGRCFINVNGSIVTTKYVTKKAVKGVKKIIFPNVIYTVLTGCAMLVLLSSFCQQTDFRLSDVETFGPALENSIILIENQINFVSTDTEDFLNDNSQMQTETNSAKITIKNSLNQATENISASGKKIAISVEMAIAKIEANAEMFEKKFNTVFDQVFEAITIPKNKKMEGNNDV